MDRQAWRATVHGVTKSRTWLSTQAINYLIKACMNIHSLLSLWFSFTLFQVLVIICWFHEGICKFNFKDLEYFKQHWNLLFSSESCLTLWPHELQHSGFPVPSLSPGVCSDSCQLNQWCYLTNLSLRLCLTVRHTHVHADLEFLLQLSLSQKELHSCLCVYFQLNADKR